MTSRHDTTPAVGTVRGSLELVGAGSSTSLPPTPDTPPLTPPEPARCRCCAHPLTAPTSVRRLLGPVCAHRLAEALARAAGGRFAVALDVDHGGIVVRLEPVGADR